MEISRKRGVAIHEEQVTSALRIEMANTHSFGEMYTLQRAAFVDEAQLYGTPEVPALCERYDDFVDRVTASKTWIAVDRHRIVGAVSARIYHGALNVERLMVAPDRRGESISTQLMIALERYAYESGHRKIQLIVGDEAINNQLMYKHLGWCQTVTFSLTGNDAIILHTMVKTLVKRE